MNTDWSLLIENYFKDREEETYEDLLTRATQIAKNSGFEAEADGNVITVRAEDQAGRTAARDQLTKALDSLGFEFKQDNSTMGRLQRLARTEQGRKKCIYVRFKFLAGKGGSRVAMSGYEEEEKIREMVCSVPYLACTTGGSTNKSDIEVTMPGGETLSIEVKTNLGADFGQIKMKYDPIANKWEAARTPNYLAHESLNKGLVGLVQKFMDANCKFSKSELKNSAVKMVKDKDNGKIYVTGIRPTEDSADFANMLRKRWFGGESHYMDVENAADLISSYYVNKGDEYMQISNDSAGLFALSSLGVKKLDVPLFASQNIRGRIRIRLKTHGGSHGPFSFTLALKLLGSLDKSPINLSNFEGVVKLATAYFTNDPTAQVPDDFEIPEMYRENKKLKLETLIKLIEETLHK